MSHRGIAGVTALATAFGVAATAVLMAEGLAPAATPGQYSVVLLGLANDELHTGASPPPVGTPTATSTGTSTVTPTATATPTTSSTPTMTPTSTPPPIQFINSTNCDAFVLGRNGSFAQGSASCGGSNRDFPITTPLWAAVNGGIDEDVSAGVRLITQFEPSRTGLAIITIKARFRYRLTSSGLFGGASPRITISANVVGNATCSGGQTRTFVNVAAPSSGGTVTGGGPIGDPALLPMQRDERRCGADIASGDLRC